MTQQDDITQRVLTDEQIQALWDEACKDSPQAPGWNRHIRFARALLSKVPAPVAGERATKALNRIERRASDDGRQRDIDDLAVVRAALASAPVADERAAVDPCGYVAVKVAAVDWLKDKFPALTIKAGLCERIGGRLYTITRLMRDHDAALASAPVAGEAQSEASKLAEELGDLASDMVYEANQEMDQDKASRAALIERGERALRRFADAAPQASAVAGEAQPLGYVRKGREWPNQCYYPSSHKPTDIHNWTPVFDHAAPQASAEDVRDVNAAMAAEYQQWIDWYHKGLDYDGFLKECVFSKTQADKDGEACTKGDGNV